MDPLNILLWILVILFGLPIAIWIATIVFGVVIAIIYVISEAWKNTKR